MDRAKSHLDIRTGPRQFGDDPRHDLGGVVLALTAVEAQRERERVGEVIGLRLRCVKSVSDPPSALEPSPRAAPTRRKIASQAVENKPSRRKMAPPSVVASAAPLYAASAAKRMMRRAGARAISASARERRRDDVVEFVALAATWRALSC